MTNSTYPDEIILIPIAPPSIYPGVIAPIVINKNLYQKEMEEFLVKDSFIGVNIINKEENGQVFTTGVLCKVLKKIKLENETLSVLVQGVQRYKILESRLKNTLYFLKYEVLQDIQVNDPKTKALMRSILAIIKGIAEYNQFFNDDLRLSLLNTTSPGVLSDLIAFALNLEFEDSQELISTLSVKKRLVIILQLLKDEEVIMKIQKKITDEVNQKVNKQQREFFLREQLKVIQNELSEDSSKLGEFKKLYEDAGKLPEDVDKVVREELEKLKALSEQSPEHQVSRNYIQWILSLPWNKSSEDLFDLQKAKKILDKDHYGLKKVKERILEFLAVKKLKPNYNSTILCLVGPPGVGKTSLGESIARSLSKEFFRFSLGGMRDEAEIKGHRRTYIGSLPGKIIQALKKVQVNNPLIMLDEIDKLAYSYQGDPASALLEVLDPEQNKTFADHYLDVPFDLSKILFIATANSINDIPEALLDRMEVIEIPGYSLEEKLEITKTWLLPKLLKKHGLSSKDLLLKKDLIKKIVEFYAREAGIRSLEKILSKLCRKLVLEKVSKHSIENFYKKLTTNVEDILGPKRFDTEKAAKVLRPGIVTGLAWTGYGGDILFVESIPLEGKGLKLTGLLGEVMNESANLAYSYIKQVLQKEKKKDYLSKHEIHVHLPAGGIPKDGPSAGITLALALYSLATNKSVKSSMAMTGELSLTGRVLPVGGIKEKILAAKRAGIKEIILPSQNEKDLKDIPLEHRKGIIFKTVKHFDEVLAYSFKKSKKLK